ncbi:MAG: hypothetical protein ABSG53_07965 [Thermoguttaceae bacterium]|jgi:hypothetical protein
MSELTFGCGKRSLWRDNAQASRIIRHTTGDAKGRSATAFFCFLAARLSREFFAEVLLVGFPAADLHDIKAGMRSYKTMNWKARFWWRVREWWHAPHEYVQCLKPDTFWTEPVYWRIVWLQRERHGLLGPASRLFRRHFKAMLRRGYWRLRWWSDFHCYGNAGGWRTRFCDWLEDRARANEENRR